MAIHKRKLKGRKTWAYRVLIDRECAGKRQRQFVGTFRTRKEAEAAERRALEERARGIDLVPNKVSVSEMLDRWMRDRKAQNLAAKTLEEDEAKINLHVKPRIGGIKVCKLRPAHLSQLYADLLEKGRLKQRPTRTGLSAKTVRHIHGLLHTALEHAVRMQLAPLNVARAVIPPKVRKTESKALAPEQFNEILKIADAGRLGNFVRLAFLTGARRGELLGLKWDAVDLDRGIMVIRVSLSETRGRKLAEKRPKTDRIRTVGLTPMALEALRKQHVAQAQDKLAAGVAYENKDGYVFTDPLGRPLVPSYVTDQFRKIAKAAGVKGRLHDARHTCASYMIAEGADVISVQSVLGHAAASTTLNLYSHAIAEARTTAVAGIEKRLQRAKAAKASE
jgi:integrase